jgi:apolipoprotein N-acyltransferase
LPPYARTGNLPLLALAGLLLLAAAWRRRAAAGAAPATRP